MRSAKLVVLPRHTLLDHASRPRSVLFARYFVVVISCVVHYISSTVHEGTSLTEQLCICHYRVAVVSPLALRGPLLVDILCA